jgi:hypothetical protein
VATQSCEVSADTPFEAARTVLFRLTPGLRQFVLDMNEFTTAAARGAVRDAEDM